MFCAIIYDRFLLPGLIGGGLSLLSADLSGAAVPPQLAVSSDSSEQEGSQRMSAQDAVEPETDVGAFCPISRLEALHLDRPEALCLRNAERSPLRPLQAHSSGS